MDYHCDRYAEDPAEFTRGWRAAHEEGTSGVQGDSHPNGWHGATLGETTSGVQGDSHPDASESDTDPEDAPILHIKILSQTMLPDGRLSIVVDLGSMIDVIGADTEMAFTARGNAHGYETVYIPRMNQLQISGVMQGSDPTVCYMEAELPIAARMIGGEATKDTFRANIAQGSGSGMPAVVGLTTLREKDAVILCREGKEMIAFPGDSGYEIHWSPGTRLIPLVPAPSGHLVIPSDHFEELPTEEQGRMASTTDHRTMSIAEQRPRARPTAQTERRNRNYAGFNALSFDEANLRAVEASRLRRQPPWYRSPRQIWSRLTENE